MALERVRALRRAQSARDVAREDRAMIVLTTLRVVILACAILFVYLWIKVPNFFD